MTARPVRIAMVAGEASGDLLASQLLLALRETRYLKCYVLRVL